MKNTALVAIASAFISVSRYRIAFEKPQALIAQEKCSNNSTHDSTAKEEYKPTAHLQIANKADTPGYCRPHTFPIARPFYT